MRFFEFNTAGSSDTVSQLIDLVKDADTDGKIRQEIMNILITIKNKSTKTTETLNIDTNVIAEIESDEAYYQQMLDSDPRLRSIAERKIKEAETSAHVVGQQFEFRMSRDISDRVEKSANRLSAKINDTLDEFNQQYLKQIQAGDPDAPKRAVIPADELNSDIVNLIKGIFNEPIRKADTPESRNTAAEEILKFMDRCVTGIVDLKKLVAAGGKNIYQHINKEDKIILDKLENSLLRAKPGKTAGNWGPGELGLAIIGTPVIKGAKGDLDIGGEMIELKASRNPKKGGRLGSTALQRGSDGRSIYSSSIGLLLTTAGYTNIRLMLSVSNDKYVGNYRNARGQLSKVSHLNFGQTFVNKCLNPRIKDRITPADTLSFLEKIANSCVIEEYKNKISIKSKLKNSVNSDGTINIDEFIIVYSEMLYGLYQKVDRVGKIMMLNPDNGSFHILKSPSDIRNSPVVFGTTVIDFKDTQGKASPQIGIA